MFVDVVWRLISALLVPPPSHADYMLVMFAASLP